MLSESSPAKLVLDRCRAFVIGDFAFIYDTHHPQSFFRRLYPDRNAYLDFARTDLRDDFQIRECRILKEDVGQEEARIIYYLDILYQGTRRESYELCWFRRLRGEWTYFATQKMDAADFAGRSEDIGWEDFERVEEKLIF